MIFARTPVISREYMRIDTAGKILESDRFNRTRDSAGTMRWKRSSRGIALVRTVELMRASSPIGSDSSVEIAISMREALRERVLALASTDISHGGTGGRNGICASST